MAAAGGVSKKKEARVFDTSRAKRGVWLVKVPNYISEAWKNAGPYDHLGKMRIAKRASQAQVQFLLAPDLVKFKTSEGKELELPREHKVNIQELSTQCLSVFSEDLSSGSLTAEGKIIQRSDIQPVDSSIYMELKKHQIKQAEKTKFTAQHTNVTPTNIVPVSRHKEYDTTEKVKKARESKEVVFDLLFSAFQHHQYYNVKDLINITQQPEAYLKEILKEVCVYNTKAPHKYMWELKPEYKMSQSTSSTSK